MRLVIQRVDEARVDVDGQTLGAVKRGFMVLVGAEQGDTEQDMRYCADKLIGLRVFEDENEKMNLSIADVGGEVLLVSQFTLLGDARHGRRPSFSNAAHPDLARPMLEEMRQYIEAHGIPVQTGRFGADMKVSLVNDGPVTILLDSRRCF